MTDGHSDNFPSNEQPSPEKIKQRAAIMRKLQELTQEDDPVVRKRLTHELTLEISEMLLENQEMKKELIAFVKRLRGDH
ncbi:MAG: hypothetical protein R8G66_11965 [Cytophagales bacterium]|nr:hypothetical protein [Cytophagales bacterium]